MAGVLQTFLDAYPSTKLFWILSQISLIFLPGVQAKKSVKFDSKYNGLGNGLVPSRQQAIIYTTDDPVH